MTGAPGNWMIHTPAKAGCPGLVLHVMRVGNDLKGFAATGDMAAMSRLTGTIDDRQQFMITMTAVDGKDRWAPSPQLSLMDRLPSNAHRLSATA